MTSSAVMETQEHTTEGWEEQARGPARGRPGRAIGWWARMGLGSRLALAAGVVVAIGLGLALKWGLEEFERTFTEVMKGQQWEAVKAAAEELDGKVAAGVSVMESVARQAAPEFGKEGVEAELTKVEAELTKDLDRRPFLRKAFALGALAMSADGKTRALSEEGRAAELKEKLLLEKAAAQALRTGQLVELDPEWVSKAADGHQRGRSRTIAVVMAAPSRNEAGEVVGAIAGGIDLLSDDYAGDLASKKMGKTGYFYLTSTRRVMLAHPDESRLMRPTAPKGVNQALDKAIDEGFEGVELTVNSTGLKAYAGFVRLKNMRAIMAANYPYAEAREPFANAVRLVGGVTALVALLIVALTGWLARKAMAPIEDLAKHLSKVASGDARPWEHREGAGREERRIARAYNEMLRKLEDEAAHRAAAQEELKELNERLESRVEERTRKLEAANEELVEAMDRMEMLQKEMMRQEKLAALGKLVAGVAHEVNTPIGNARLVASALGGKSKEMARKIKACEPIRKGEFEQFGRAIEEAALALELNLERAADLISSFKQVSADQAGQRRRKFDLLKTCEEMGMTAEHAARRKGVELRVEGARGVEIDGYPGAMGQVVAIMISNALAHAFGEEDEPAKAPEGRPPMMRLEIKELAERKGWARMIFEDNGSGIDKAALEKVFDPFFTTKLGRGGTGLGLSIARGIITDLMGGSMRVESGEWGTCFVMEFPKDLPGEAVPAMIGK